MNSATVEQLLPRSRVLVIEDAAALSALYLAYQRDAPWQKESVDSAVSAIEAFERAPPTLALLDLNLPDANDLELFEQLRSRWPDVGILVLTANGSVDLAVQALQAGALDFLEKPVQRDRLLGSVRGALERIILRRQLDILLRDGPRERFHGFIGASAVMQGVYRTIRAAAPSRATVFITGESGTGKEVCAQAIHDESPRSSRPFVPVNCAAIPRDLMESEIFGHVKGAFTGAVAAREGAAEQAEGGTLFLDEIGELPLDLQSKLLRFLQTGVLQRVGSAQSRSVDVRIVCATNRNPWDEVLAGRFREDLYYRLNVIPIELPPLRDREDDVAVLASAFLLNRANEEDKDFTGFTAEAMQAIRKYDWPGNVRELANAIQNIVVLHRGGMVGLSMLPRAIRDRRPGAQFRTAIVDRPPVGDAPQPAAPITASARSLAISEREAVETALRACAGNVPRAAVLLEVNPSTVYRMLHRWGVRAESYGAIPLES